ncbi:GTPase SAR1 family protein [Actinoplanes tereljensis]|uniref:Double-GTPase 2 domain-containing protein n=1 Tax=Paractinoplanes tereljensis TaxID=571912 RepID=A0A919NY69_9ACTN|nr:hypothetical protein [Actinoplanes tereljensis]GIF26533.1 hypothetical protein Ate02nite_92630 [Actinoplanes tereljensis]
MTGTVHCPYCYRSLPPREIMFRCAGRLGSTGRRCEARPDQVLVSYADDNRARHPAFKADGRRRSAVHADCGVETTHRICPHCHSQLPTHFGDADNRLIALVGAKESGKTVFMTVLLHELRNRVGARFGLSVMAADDHTRNQFPADYEDRLYDDRLLHDPTRTAGGSRGGRRPLVFSMSRQRRRLGRAQVNRSLFSFFDTAGEDLRSGDSVERNVRYLTGADGIILLLDPLQMRGARALAEPGALLPDPSVVQDDPASVLGRITDLMHSALPPRHSGLIRKPIAVAFSKMDALEHTLPEEAALLRESAHGDAAYDEPDGAAVHQEIRAVLQKWQGGSIDLVLSQNFERYRFFGVSALGASPVRAADNQQRVSEYGVQPRRVQDPFLWLLSTFGTIPAGRS